MSHWQPGIGVRPPRAADVGVALQDHEVLDSLLLQADRHAEAAEAGAEDRDPDIAGAWRAAISLLLVGAAVNIVVLRARPLTLLAVASRACCVGS